MLGYDYYKECIKNGDIISFSSVPDEKIIDMFIHEQKTDKEISKLFGVKPNTVASRRRKIGITKEDQQDYKEICSNATLQQKNDTLWLVNKMYKQLYKVRDKNSECFDLCSKLWFYTWFKELPEFNKIEE